jgi:hypothetical protein
LEPPAEPAPDLQRVNSRGHSITLDVVDALSQAFNLLHNHSLKHDIVQAINDERVGKAAMASSSRDRPDGSRNKLYRAATRAELAQSAAARRGLEAEPEVANKADWAAWREWACRRSLTAAQLAHPRKVAEGGLLEPFRLSAPMSEVADVAGGVATQLYFDFLRLMGGVCALGFLISTPAIVYSARYQHASLRATGLLTSTDLFGASQRPLGACVPAISRPLRRPSHRRGAKLPGGWTDCSCPPSSPSLPSTIPQSALFQPAPLRSANPPNLPHASSQDTIPSRGCRWSAAWRVKMSPAPPPPPHRCPARTCGSSTR